MPNEYGACPDCGAYWGHPDPKLDFPNRQKVDNYWKCYNSESKVGFYDPATQEVVELKPSSEEEARISEEARAWVDSLEVDQEIELSPGITTITFKKK